MARPLRIEYKGALYHVMSRGNACQDIFLNDKDRIVFLENTKHCIKQHNLICHAYCLMDNHYHLLLETPEGNLSTAMRDINGNFTQSFNARHRRIGHVLQGRYKAFVIEKEVYLLKVVRYIVNNPVNAKIVTHPREWKWSSYKATAGLIKTPDWLETDYTLGLFSQKKKEAQKTYRQFVSEYIAKNSPYNELKEGIILGSPQFVDWIWNHFSESEDMKEVITSDRMIGRPTLQDLFQDGINKKERNDLIRLAKIRAAYSVTDIARHLKLHRTTVSRILNED